MANTNGGNCWDMVAGKPAAGEILKQLIDDNPCHEDYCELAESALALSGE
jgi:hypothetical protein